MFWEVILLFLYFFTIFEFWNISWHSSLKRDAKLRHTQVIVSDPERSCSSNKPGGGEENKQNGRQPPSSKKWAWENSRHFEMPPLVSPRDDVWRTLKRSNSFHTDDAQLTTQIWTVLLIGWSKCLTNQKHYLYLGSDTSTAWNFYLRSSDVISPEN